MHWRTQSGFEGFNPIDFLIVIIIIERRDYGGVLSEDCEDTEQSSEKVPKVRETVLRTRNCQTRPKLSCRIASSEQFSLQVPLKR